MQKHVYKLVRTHSGECFNFNFTSLFPFACLAQFSLNNVHKGGLQQHQFIGRTSTVSTVCVTQAVSNCNNSDNRSFVCLYNRPILVNRALLWYIICENTIFLSVIFTSMSKPSETFIMTTKLLPVFHRNLAPLI